MRHAEKSKSKSQYCSCWAISNSLLLICTGNLRVLLLICKKVDKHPGGGLIDAPLGIQLKTVLILSTYIHRAFLRHSDYLSQIFFPFFDV